MKLGALLDRIRFLVENSYVTLRRNSSPSLNCAFPCAVLDFADARHTRFVATAFFRK